MRLACVVLVVFLSAACGVSDPDGPGADGSGGSGGSGGEGGTGGAGAPTRTGYPPAPYGLREGSTIANLAFTAPDGTAFTLRDVHADGRNHTLLLTSAAGWSSGSLEMQPRLRQLYGEYAAAGLAVVVAVFENPEYYPATPEYAEAWQERYGLPFPVVADTAFVLADYYDRTMTPMDMVLDLDTMRIALIETGFDEALVRDAIEASLER